MFSCLCFPLCWLHSQPGSSSEGLVHPPPLHGPPRTSSLLSESISFLMMSEKASGFPPVGPHWSRAQPKLVWWLGTPGLGRGGVCITERSVGSRKTRLLLQKVGVGGGQAEKDGVSHLGLREASFELCT